MPTAASCTRTARPILRLEAVWGELPISPESAIRHTQFHRALQLATQSENPDESPFIAGPALVAYVSALELVLHLPNPGGYGLFTDELYFLACGEHLSWGYADMPPLTALQAWIVRDFLGDSMLAIRLIPALASVGLVLLTGAIVRQLGGGRFAQVLAAVAVLIAPFYLAVDSYLSMNSVEPLLWMGCALTLIRMIKTGETRLWLWFGVIAGIGLENKDTMAMFGFALMVGLLMTPERRLMNSRWLLIGAMMAMLIFLPNLIWVVQHHFPHVEMLANIKRNRRNVALSPLGFFINCAAGLPHQVFGIGKGLKIAAAQTVARPQPTRNFAGNGDSWAAGHGEQHLRSARPFNAQKACARG